MFQVHEFSSAAGVLFPILGTVPLAKCEGFGEGTETIHQNICMGEEYSYRDWR